MTRRERNRLTRKHEHARRCPNCGCKLITSPAARPAPADLCVDCRQVMDLINHRLARYTQRLHA